VFPPVGSPLLSFCDGLQYVLVTRIGTTSLHLFFFFFLCSIVNPTISV